jgi:adenosylcobinamide-GDP ribazoletransferase
MLLAPMLGRWGLAFAVVGFPYARAEGLGRVMKDNSGWPDFCLATICTVLVTIIIAIISLSLWMILIMALVIPVTWLLIWLILKRIPGLTGDVYGTICEAMEVFVLLMMSIV